MTEYPVGTRMVFYKQPGDGFGLDSYDRFNGKTITLTERLVVEHPSADGRGVLANGDPISFYTRWVKPIKTMGFGNWIRTKGK